MTTSFTPQGPRWYTTPRIIDIPVEEIVKGPYPDEIGVRIKLNGLMKTAVVPSEAVNEDAKTVRGTIIGETDEGLLLVLPATSMGRTIIEVKQEVLNQLVGD